MMKTIPIKTPRLIAGGVFSYLALTFVSYRVFSSNSQILSPGDPLLEQASTQASPQPQSKFRFDPLAPKTEASPLNGVIFSKEEMAFLSKRRPLGIMIENHVDARPQSGLSSADIVYEAVAEGGITRFLAIYWGIFDDITVAPVRSSRTYYLDWISEYDALYAHVGAANCNQETGSGCANGAPADALGQIAQYGIKSLNQYNVGFPTYVRDYDRLAGRPIATEHTMVSSTNKLWQAAEEMGWTAVTEEGSWTDNFRPWKFKDDPLPAERPETQSLEFYFWQARFTDDFRVRWEYDRGTNSYLRYLAGTPHFDLNNNEQIKAKNVVILFMVESTANDGYPDNVHLLYDTIGEGEALIFQDGHQIEGTWKKGGRTKRTIFYDAQGKEINLTRGPVWIEILPVGNRVKTNE